ncbi:MAG: F0F1 ATP synthase subunit B [Bacteroidetes bacterium]|nr:F0F1 ATP synthase subunit B [Bacteroidota bacterium]
MDLVTPDLGLLFWTGLVFCLLLFVLTKFAWKPILKMVNEREQKISEALDLAEKTKAEMQAMQSENEALLKEARAQRDSMLKDAKNVSDKMIEEAKEKAKSEAQKIVNSAKDSINSEKLQAMNELKTHVAGLSLEIAEKIIRTELSTDDKQKALAEKMADDINMN